jgi:hypothetical protein
MRTCGSAIKPFSFGQQRANPGYGTELAPMKDHYPAAVDSIADDSSPWQSAPMACHAKWS